MLDQDTLDLAVGRFEKGAKRHRVQRLIEQSLACILNPELVTAAGPATLADDLELPHAW